LQTKMERAHSEVSQLQMKSQIAAFEWLLGARDSL